ncbi:hypothetical protein A8C32_08035 [Flavivirga aquatica]|uniref:Uncharacterized protein n=2 Tax=Flavivirga aquatica TaxID=1849968 RepID=A0A1E5SJ20_9FLAO|nr:hypothetical protein A8C32_08035 [Flavivirga aquatica]
MGIGFTADTPAKVAHLGIDSVISLVDDELLEKLRKVYSENLKLPFTEIKSSFEDFRAKRITSYLNLIQTIAEEKFNTIKNINEDYSKDLKQYLSLLPNSAQLKAKFKKFYESTSNKDAIKKWLDDTLSMGSIDVNIMTKVDKENYQDGEKLDNTYNDAHAALRGFAKSNLNSSLVLSAGMNPRLYGYIETFEDFYPDENGVIKKKIVLKVSDYRSALIQGKFLAKKGIWVSEFRIESGLNCGGHAFATDGYLMGPILAQFRDSKQELTKTLYDILKKALIQKGKPEPNTILPIKISAQGGVGTTEEHQFLQEHYNVDSVGWGSPFLLVPEATLVDTPTREKLEKAQEKDIYLSDISPLGIPFNNLRGNTKDAEKEAYINKGRPGSSCPKKFVSLNKEFDEKGLCTASRQYQFLKLKALDEKGLPKKEYEKQFNKITEKSCTCVGLGTAALLVNNIDTKVEGSGVSICPGPNLAYFSKTMKLKEMVDHIYHKNNVIDRKDRPNIFIKELSIYMEYLKKQIDEHKENLNIKQHKYLSVFIKNMIEGVSYYQQLFSQEINVFKTLKSVIFNVLEKEKNTLLIYQNQINYLNPKKQL